MSSRSFESRLQANGIKLKVNLLIATNIAVLFSAVPTGLYYYLNLPGDKSPGGEAVIGQSLRDVKKIIHNKELTLNLMPLA